MADLTTTKDTDFKHIDSMAAMDPAKELELSILARQKPMIDAIAQGDSPVQLFYKDATVFLTGGSGFLGKQLIEKLFRSCEIKKLYMLLRSKKGDTIQQRLDATLRDPLYDTLRKQQPYFANKIVPLEGNVENIRLGLNDHDWIKLTEEVNVIFHVAATVKFNEPIKKATLINIRGTREALTLGKHCKNLKCFNHISTAFAHATQSRIDTDVEEKLYPSPVPPQVLIELVETVDEARLDAITPNLIKDWPNTYTFTKAITEELIRISSGDMPICIVKPPVVVSTYIEPAPGWIDLKSCLSSPLGGLLAVGLGILHTILVNRDTSASYAPVDYVNNAIISASWDTVEKRKHRDNGVSIYTISTSGQNNKWGFFCDVLNSKEALTYVSPKAVWYCFGFETSSKLIYWLLMWILHYIPGYLIDGILDVFKLRPKGIPPLVDIYTRIYKLTLVYRYFSFNYWNFRDDNLKGMIERMSEQDRVIFNCDVRTIDFKEQIFVWGIGLRRYIIKDDLEGSAVGKRNQKYLFKYANMLFLAVYGYLIYILLRMIYSVFVTLLQFLYK